MPVFDKAVTTLEYLKILNHLSECCHTEGSALLAMKLMPSNDIDKVKFRQKQTSDAKKLAALKGTPSFGGIKDINASLERADKNAILTMRELLDIAAVLRTARLLIDYINSVRDLETVLEENFGRLSANRSFEERIYRTIISEDMIADEASPELSEIRRKIRNTQFKIKDLLQKFVSGEYTKYLQDNIITQRGGRYVIPVKSEYRNEIKGLTHDISASGATIFIEPMAVVDANNELRELESAETHEIERILAELSAMCAENSADISLNYYNITELAFIFGRAEYSFQINAAEPRITAEKTVELYHARHPLLDSKTVVPINIFLGGHFDTLVITGPNTGGKTVSLKTLGLLCLMCQAGIHIPADDTSVMPVFRDILADIGDEQSIEQSLSTFSAHMTNIIKIIDDANEGSLILFDELGAGTDPVEGAALAIAILENVRKKKVLSAATTHYAELKEYALNTEGVTNASCEFDIDTLKPTYKLIIGTPGRSNAFAISTKLGLPESIVNRARELVSGDDKKFEDTIDKLEKIRIDLENQRNEAVKIRREYELYSQKTEAALKKKVEETEKELEKSRIKSIQLIESARVSSEFIFEQLAEMKKARETGKLTEEMDAMRDEIRKTLRERGNEINPVKEKIINDYKPPRPFTRGDEVVLININKLGVLLESPDNNGEVTVQAGIIKMKTNIKNLMLADTEKVTVTDANKRKVGASNYKTSVRADIKSELDLRGMNGEDAWASVDKYLDEIKMINLNSARLIHGKGTGALRKSLQENLKNDPRIKSFRPGKYGEGDSGVTVVELK